MGKQFIKLTLNFEYEREVLINIEYLINVVEYEDFTLVTMNNGDKYEVKESADEVNNLIEGKEPQPINVPWTNPIPPTRYGYVSNITTTNYDSTQFDTDNLTLTSVNTGVVSTNSTDGITTLDVNKF